jgi:hypothetical protein
LKIGDFEKHSFFESANLDFKKNLLSKVLGYQGWDKILMITPVSSQKSLPTNISAASVCSPKIFRSSDSPAFYTWRRSIQKAFPALLSKP